MNQILSDLMIGINATGDIQKDAVKLFNFRRRQDIAEHTVKVAHEARKLACKFGVDKYKALLAACLHDLGNLVPDDKKIMTCEKLGINILPDEYIAPSLLHSKISRVMAMEMFCVEDKDILSAIECHSTLRGNAGRLDMVLFVADKISWDHVHNQFFIKDILSGLEESLERGVFAYVKYLYTNREDMKVFHPWTLEAYNDLLAKLK